MKLCPDCGSQRPLEDFPRNRSTADGRASYCKAHHNERTRASRERNGGARRYHLRRRYGVEPEQFDAVVADQAGLCAICRKTEATHLDHDHLTGDMRGALCVACNNGLGLFRDDPERLEAAARYLRHASRKAA